MIQSARSVRPLHDRVLIRRLESVQTTQGGIIIPDTAQEKTQMGTVVAIGEGKVNGEGVLRPLKVQVGDIVLFGKYSGTEVRLGNEDLLILKEDEILGIIEK